jgi:predicted enzyme related to lactoylglutathione lyase
LILRNRRITTGEEMKHPVVHVELHTQNLARACAFYRGLLGWQPQRLRAAGAAYQSWDFGAGLGGGVVECRTERALWLPYVEVSSVAAATKEALALGGAVMLAPREGPAGWRSVVSTPAGGEIALWQMKR